MSDSLDSSVAVAGSRAFQDRLHKSDWLIADASLDKSRPLVEEFHYAAGGSNTATFLHGLYRRSDFELYGVAWWIPPTRGAAASFWHNPEQVLCLSRLVIAPGVPKNAATFLLMNSVRRVSSLEWPCLITYADTWRGHTGHIYRCAGWEYCGLTKPERTYVLGGRLVARKAGPRTRTHAEMLALGAECIGSFAKHRFRLVRKVGRQAAAPRNESFDFSDPAAIRDHSGAAGETTAGAE